VAVAALRRRLAQHQVVFLDTMVFVYILEQNPAFATLAEAVLESVEVGELRAITSALTLAEVLTGPSFTQNTKALSDYELYITHFPNLMIHSVESQHARRIAEVRASTRLRMPDAIQIAIAAYAGATAVVGNDKGWKGKTAPLDLLLLSDFADA
jgi:predicted nucleic acid-binding protein